MLIRPSVVEVRAVNVAGKVAGKGLGLGLEWSGLGWRWRLRLRPTVRVTWREGAGRPVVWSRTWQVMGSRVGGEAIVADEWE